MRLFNLLSGASLGVLAFAAFELPALGQEQLPPIEIGKAKPVAAHGGKGSGTSPGLAGRGKAGAGRGPSVAGAGSVGVGTGTGAGAAPYGGAGPAQDPYNKSYVLEKASAGTKTNTPVMDTPLNVQLSASRCCRISRPSPSARRCRMSAAFPSTDGTATVTGFASSGILRAWVFRANLLPRRVSRGYLAILEMVSATTPCSSPTSRAWRCSKVRAPFFTGSSSRAESSISTPRSR